MKIKARTYYEISVTEQEDKTIQNALRLLDDWCCDDEARGAFDSLLPLSVELVEIRDLLENLYNLLLIEEEE